MIAQDLHKYITNKQINTIDISDLFIINNYINLTLPVIVKEVSSYGKKIIIELNSNQLLVVFLGMSGKFRYTPAKHDHVIFNFDNFSLYYNNVRRIGAKIDLIYNKEKDQYFSKYGPCLLPYIKNNTCIRKKSWKNLFTNKLGKRKIIDILIDQSIICGIGWYLATDILYKSKIHPFRIGSSIIKKELNKLRINTHKIISKAYIAGGLTIMNYTRPNDQIGVYETLIYGKDKDKYGNKVKHLKHGNRTIHYVNKFQKI